MSGRPVGRYGPAGTWSGAVRARRTGGAWPGARLWARSAGYGCWKPAPWRIFCAAGVESQATNAAAASLCLDAFSVAAG